MLTKFFWLFIGVLAPIPAYFSLDFHPYSREIIFEDSHFKPSEKNRLSEALLFLIKNAFPEIQEDGFEITIYTLDDADFYFESYPTPLGLLGANLYKIGVNPIVFEKNISDFALQAILAHELFHTLDYHNGWTVPDILTIWAKSKYKQQNIQYERYTDERTIAAGFGEGLIQFRQWQTPHLSTSAKFQKRELYLTPSEIRLFIKNTQQ